MDEMKKRRFRTIETDMEEMEQKIKNHRRKVAKIMTLFTICILLLLVCFAIYFKTKTYTAYEVEKKVERQDTTDTRFMEYNGNVLKYSNDGAFCTNLDDVMIWNQTYQMNNPIVDICGEYVVIAEQKGTIIYVLNSKGLEGEIETTMPIVHVEVANQGTVAVLMQEDNTSYIQLYDTEGEELAQGEYHTENSGFPMDLTLSEDAKKMAVTTVKIDDGNITGIVNFYNFGTVGQNEIDNLVSSYKYEDVLIPQIEFINNETAVAFGDTQIMVYTGTQKPEEKTKLKLNHQISDIVYNREYFGYTYLQDKGYKVELYDKNGKCKLEKTVSMMYDNIELLSNNEVVFSDGNKCYIYDISGIERFKGKTDKPLLKVIKNGKGREYIFILENETDTIRLK